MEAGDVLHWMKQQWDSQLELAKHLQEQNAVLMREQQKPLLDAMQALLSKPQEQPTGDPMVIPGSGLNASHVFSLGQLSPNDNIDDFIDAFERIGGALKWPSEQWATRFAVSLTGEALSAYKAMPATLAANCNEIKKVVKDRLGLTTTHYRRLFREARLKPQETPKALQQRLKNLAWKWLTPEGKNLDTILDTVVLEQFVQAVPKEMRTYLMLQNCQSTEEAAMLADRFLEAQIADPSGFGVMQAAGLAMGKRGKDPKGKWYDMQNVKPRNDNDVFSYERKCYLCGKTGHFKRECDVRTVLMSGVDEPAQDGFLLSVQIEGVEAQALLDSGADQSMISSRLWEAIKERRLSPPSQAEGQVRVRCVHGASSPYSLHMVKVRGLGTTHSLLVAIIPRLPHEVVLGHDWPPFCKEVEKGLNRLGHRPALLTTGATGTKALTARIPAPLFEKIKKVTSPTQA